MAGKVVEIQMFCPCASFVACRSIAMANDEKIYMVLYEAQKNIVPTRVELLSPRLTKKDAVDFISKIGVNRLVQIFENGELVEFSKRKEIVRAALVHRMETVLVFKAKAINESRPCQ